MNNSSTALARSYHDSTKHTWHSVHNSMHFLDWNNQPRLYKVYPGLDPIPLPSPLAPSERPALEALTIAGGSPAVDSPVVLSDLAAILRYSAGVVRRRAYPDGEIRFRAAACTGALYSIELYAVAGTVDGLDAGIYLFSPADYSMRLLSRGDFRGFLVRASGGESHVSHAPVTLVCTGTYWRNAWKYQARTYRHFGWDNGTIIANLLAVAAARNIPARVVNGFVDRETNELLGLDDQREVALNLIPLGYSSTTVSRANGQVPAIQLQTLPYSHREVDYPAMRQVHAASSLTTEEEVTAWRSLPGPGPGPRGSAPGIPLDVTGPEALSRDTVEQVISRRGSARRFEQTPIPFAQLSTCLRHATQGLPADFLMPDGSQLNDIYLVVHSVDGLEPGAYVLHREPWELELLRAGSFRAQTGRLGLDQALAADCSAAVFFLADLDQILTRFGNRGYRATQLEAGAIGGRIYIAAYAQRLAATGLTFFDDEVTAFFSPHAARKSAIFLVALGIKRRATDF